MPHLTVEYTGNWADFDPVTALRQLNEVIASTKLFNEADVKSRAIRCESFQVGTAPAVRAFVHVELAIFEGRSLPVKQKLSESLLAVLQRICREPKDTHVQLSVEIREISRECYSKASFGG